LRTSSTALEAARRGRGLTQAELAKRARVSRDTVIRLEHGDLPNLVTALALSRALGVSLWIFGDGADGASSWATQRVCDDMLDALNAWLLDQHDAELPDQLARLLGHALNAAWLDGYRLAHPDNDEAPAVNPGLRDNQQASEGGQRVPTG
jgi:transcriptional regulator with XRE-family HTH domain